MKTALVAAYYGPQDPPTANLCRYLRERGWRVAMILRSRQNIGKIIAYQLFLLPEPRIRRIASLSEYLNWGKVIRRAEEETSADLFVSFMLHPWVAAGKLGSVRRVCCLYDIPPEIHTGMLSRIIYRRAWKNLCGLDLVWSSDPLKAEICQKLAGLSEIPMVCHNVPYSDYILDTELSSERHWLKDYLITSGVVIKAETRILLRAGAFGPMGGIEETLRAIVKCPNWVFVLMGRPEKNYENRIRSMVTNLNIEDRVAYVLRPNDREWKNALIGADVGHLIHERAETGVYRETFDKNSSLSNNRLFQYMAAGLPIISYDDPRMDGIHSAIQCFQIANSKELEVSLTNGLITLENTPDLIETLGANGRRAHLMRYNWEMEFSPIAAKLLNFNE